MSFVVTGTGRCGTGFTARVLTSAGVPTGHENHFTVDPYRKRYGLAGDCSWLAVPWLGRFDGPVVHLVRHPLDVVSSLVGIRMFSDRHHGDYRRFMFRHMPGLSGDDLPDAVAWWVGWNRRIEPHATMRVRVEDLDADTFRTMCHHIGYPRSRGRLEAALRDAGTGVNARTRTDVTWGDLPPGPTTDTLAEMAAVYGYDRRAGLQGPALHTLQQKAT